ncbi:MAG: VWA domain-containing protein [Calditrichaeota bacterium]|nr:MAG: VWA domain-containing protein [Calditrichota bacterium]
MEALRFAHPLWLHALWAVALWLILFGYAARQRQKALERFGESTLLNRLMTGFIARRRRNRFVLWLSAYVMLVLALSGPQLGTRLEDVKQKGNDIIVALDVSLSMQAEDIRPNRLDKAKYEIKKLIDMLHGDRIGLVAFAGIAHVQMPLTLDYAAARLFLDMMDTRLIPQPGTAIAEAIRTSVKAFKSEDTKHKVLILITDGEEHEDDPVKAAEEAAQQGVIIYTIGLGSEQGVPIPVYDARGRTLGFKKDKQGHVVTTRLDAVTLQKIALAANGKFFQAGNSGSELKEIYREVQAMDKKELSSRQFAQYEDRFQIFLLLALLFILAEAVIPERDKKAVRS